MHDRILVKRKAIETQTNSGLWISTNAEERSDQGTVQAVGQGKVLPNGTLRPLEVKAGDQVMFSQGAGSIVKIDDEEYVVLKEEDIFAILED